MSLDFELIGDSVTEECECHSCGNKHFHTIKPVNFEANITHNLNEMAEEAGIYKCLWRPDENGFKLAEDIIDPLIEGLKMMRLKKKELQKLNPVNGYGSYGVLLRFAEDILRACQEFPKAEIRVYR